MNRNLTAVARIVPLTALMLGACVSQSAYDQVQAQNQQLQAQLAQSRAEQKFVEAGDMLFPEGGFQLSQAGQAELANNIVPKLQGLQNAKVVVYGYTDNTPVGPALQRQGVPDNLVLSTRRASTVVTSWSRRESAPISFQPRVSARLTQKPRMIRRRAGRRTAGSKSPFKGLEPPPPEAGPTLGHT